MNKLKQIQYNCKQATFLIEKKALSRISFREEIELRIHLLGCGVCVLYKKQTTMINGMILQLFSDGQNEQTDYRLGNADKQKMQDKIEQELKK